MALRYRKRLRNSQEYRLHTWVHAKYLIQGQLCGFSRFFGLETVCVVAAAAVVVVVVVVVVVIIVFGGVSCFHRRRRRCRRPCPRPRPRVYV